MIPTLVRGSIHMADMLTITKEGVKAGVSS